MYLADTHVVLWWFAGSDRLGSAAAQALRSAGQAHYSAASIMEITIKAMLGKVAVPDDFGEHVATSGWIEVPVRASHAAAMARFPDLARHDPFDRILLAQAETEGLALLTADQRLLETGHSWIVDATV
ncbi:type II toxin-antitoxin system VapC family toxin [Aeromicrobium sp. CF3.5]|uniref:type II toxin-antitoxin system VapC family toxin n=1 Tax=Aeromicrobium sp. CF3.5 TaxID=3373078 RepID=UPI003EE7E807